MSKKLINLSNLQKFLLKLNEKFALKKTMKGISEDSEGNIIIGEEGLVPAPDENSKGKFLRSDGTWSIPGDSPLYDSMSQEEGIEGVSEVDRVLNAKTLKAVIEDEIATNENVVHTSGDEEVAGIKTFSSNPWVSNDQTTMGYSIKNIGMTRNDVPSEYLHHTFRAYDKNNNILGEYCVEKSTTGETELNMNARSQDSSGNQIAYGLLFKMANDGSVVRFMPSANNKVHLGDTNAKWLKVHSDDVVHTSGDEEVAGVKTFSDNMYIKRDGPRMRLQDTRCSKGTTPESSVYNQALYVYDTNHVAYGGLEHSYLSDASNQMSMISFSGTTNDNVDYAKITVGYDSNGDWYTSAPTPADSDNSTKIATTEFVSKKDKNVVHKSGDETIAGNKTFSNKIKGNLQGNADSSTYLTAQTNSAMPTETTALPKVGMYHQKVYRDGYPIEYGNLINVQGKDVGGSGQLLLGWSGTNGADANIYYRNKRDIADAQWSEWKQIAYAEDIASKYLPLSGGTLNGKLTIKNSALAMSIKDTNSDTLRTNDILFANSSNTSYGLNVGLGGCGATVVGAGESTTSQLAELEGKSEENLYLTSDVNMYFKVNANTYGNAKTISLTKDAELSGLSKVTSTSFVGSLTGNADTSTQFSANKSVALTGDVTGSASSKGGWSVATTLANSGVTAGTYGPSANVTGNNNATISVPQIKVDAKGRVTSVVNRTLTCKNTTYTKLSQFTNDSKFVTLTALGSGSSNGMQTTEVGSIMLCTCNCSVLETTSSSIQSNRSLQVPGSYLTPISWMETSGGSLVRSSPEGSSYTLTGTWRLLGNFQTSYSSSKIYYIGLFMRVV